MVQASPAAPFRPGGADGTSLRAATALRPYRHLARRRSRQIMVGEVPVGGDSPISVQSMTNTLTTDVAATVAQIHALTQAGADIVRVSCPDAASTAALRKIVREVSVPVVADIHFHYRRAIEAAAAGAACLRINPGNIGARSRVREVIAAARDHGCSMRIGVNGGSLERRLLEKYKEPTPEAMVESAIAHARLLEDENFTNFKISCKASDLLLAVAAYRKLAAAGDWPLHLGITEAGGLHSGTVVSSLGIGALLLEGIGDTLRVSLAADPLEEVRVGNSLLKALHLRQRGVTIVACPSCARQQFDVIATVAEVESRTAHITTPLVVSIIGCVVNGPGEAAVSDLGLAGGGRGTHQVYMNGRPAERLSAQDHDIADRLVDLIEKEVAAKLNLTKLSLNGDGA